MATKYGKTLYLEISEAILEAMKNRDISSLKITGEASQNEHGGALQATMVIRDKKNDLHIISLSDI